MPKLIKLPAVQNVGANLTATLPQVPHGMTYEAIIAALGGTFTKAQITGIRSRINGKQFVDITGTHLDVENQFKKMTAAATYLSLNFSERRARTIIGESIGAIDTSVGVDTFDFEFDIGAATNPTLEVWGLVSPPKPVDIGGSANQNKLTISAILKKVHTLSGAADHAVTIPMGSRLGGLIKRVHFHHTGSLTHVEAKRDGDMLQQKAPVALASFVQAELNRTTQSNHAAFDPCMTDNQSDAVSTVRNDGSPASFEFTLTTSGAETVTSYTELYSTIARL